MTAYVAKIGDDLRFSRKKAFPNDSMSAFAIRCEIGLSTYKKMEKGDLSVGMNQYFKAAQVLGLQEQFAGLFKMKEDWFND